MKQWSQTHPVLFSAVSISHCCAYGWFWYPATGLFLSLQSTSESLAILVEFEVPSHFPLSIYQAQSPTESIPDWTGSSLSISFLSSKQLSTMFTFIYNSENLDIPHTSANPHCPTLKGALDAGFFHQHEKANVSVSPPMSPCRENESSWQTVINPISVTALLARGWLCQSLANQFHRMEVVPHPIQAS